MNHASTGKMSFIVALFIVLYNQFCQRMLHDHFAIRDVTRSKSSIPPPQLSSQQPQPAVFLRVKQKKGKLDILSR